MYNGKNGEQCKPCRCFHHFRAGKSCLQLDVQVRFGTYFQQLHRDLVKNLPASVPEASKFDRLAVFGGNTKEFDDLSLEADKLWEASLNGVLKSTLGWGMQGGMEGNMDEIIRRGRWGMDGLVDFATYFVEERGVSGGLFEGKLMREFWERGKRSRK